MTFFLLGSIEIVWFLVLCACIFIGKKFLNWLQELIEDPNHVSLDRKLDELRNKGMIKHLTMDEVVEQAKREGRWSNAAVIWPSG
jgi:DNA-binding HxlR family transcriptional regulator